MTAFLPIPSPVGLRRAPEPRYPKRERRIACYGPAWIHYDVTPDCDDYDISEITDSGEKDPAMAEAIEAIQKAFKISISELIENAPVRKDA